MYSRGVLSSESGGGVGIVARFSTIITCNRCIPLPEYYTASRYRSSLRRAIDNTTDGQSFGRVVARITRVLLLPVYCCCY